MSRAIGEQATLSMWGAMGHGKRGTITEVRTRFDGSTCYTLAIKFAEWESTLEYFVSEGSLR